MTVKKTPVDVVIPYVSSTIAWQELKYALRSMEMFFSFPFNVYIVADKLPEWASDRLRLIQCDQIKGFTNAKSFDAISKMDKILSSRVKKDFIYAYDDVIFCNAISYAEIGFRWSHPPLESEANIKSFSGSGNWKDMLIQTMRRLHINKLPDYNYETHLPRIFNKSKMRELFAQYGFRKIPYYIPTVYFNKYFAEPDGLIDHENGNSRMLSYALNPETLDDLFSKKQIIVYNDDGLTDAFKHKLETLFHEKSSYEA